MSETVAKTDKQNMESKKKAKFGEGMGSFLLAVLAILAFRWALFEPYVIPSGSMIPTLLIHDHILVNKFAYGLRVPFTKTWLFKNSEPKRGDVVVFRSVEDASYFMIKRIVGLPGDKIEVEPEGYLKINGERLPSKALNVTSDPASQAPYYRVSETDLGGAFSDFDFYEEDLGGVSHRTVLTKGAPRFFDRPVTVPEGQYFCMGDNRDNSKDSRYWGALPRENLLGKALFVWLSCDETLNFVPFLCNPLKLRWGRFFHALH
ncbi:MAG: signal peptidase I [Calothrix sp. SM1_5_4]|nr:signal peptidase I [Calothrix sp. SM1_5_4]